MKRFKIFLIIFLAVILSAVQVNAEAGGGRTSANFLLLGVGAKAIGTGNAMTADDNDLFAVKYNPASLADNMNTKIGFSYSAYFENIGHHYLGYQRKNLGVSLQYLDYGKFNRTTYSGFNQIQGNFSAQDICAAVSYGYKFQDILDAGISLKYIKSKLAEFSANAMALDLGMQKEFLLFNENIRTGISILNLGSKLKYVSKDENLPLTYRLGLGYSILENINFNLDFVKQQYNEFGMQSGIEWKYKNTLAIRMGYDGLNEASKKITMGFGVKYSHLEFDYVFVPYNDLDSLHNLTVQYGFGKAEKKQGIISSPVSRKAENASISIYCINCGTYLKPYLEKYVLHFCPECGEKIYKLEK